MTVQTNHLEDVSVAIDWDATPQCEHAQHHTDPEAHDGDAAWHATTACAQCGNVRRGLRCQGWYDFAAADTWYEITCSNCDYALTAQAFFEQTVWVKL